MAVTQVNVRLDASKLEVLEAAAFVDGRSVPDLVRAAIEDLADRFSELASVQKAMEARQTHTAAERRSNVTAFPTKPGVRRASNE